MPRAAAADWIACTWDPSKLPGNVPLTTYLREVLLSWRTQGAKGGPVSTVFHAPGKVTPFRTFIYGHTHVAKPSEEYAFGDWRVKVANTGAFQRVIAPDQLPVLQRRLKANSISDAIVRAAMSRSLLNG